MKKIRIGICDDFEVIAQKLKKVIEEVWDIPEVECEVLTWTDGLLMLEQAETFHVVFLDIVMPQIDGVELGRQIKEKNPECAVILASGMTERFKEGYQIGALRFITKPFEKREVREALQAALECYTLFRTFTVYTKRNKLEFSLKQIQCVKAYDGYAQVYIDGSWYRRNSSLDELEEELDARLFMRIHRKMIVNMCWVERDAKGDFWLFGEPLPISRRKKKEFLHRYTQYFLKYRRILMT